MPKAAWCWPIRWRWPARTQPKLMVDFATLTGAASTALTERMSGVFTNRPALAEALVAAGRASGERVWNFPFDADFDATSRARWPTSCSAPSTARAITSSRPASCQRFVPEDIAWAHVDLSSATRRGGLGARQHRGHRLRRALRARAAARTEPAAWRWTRAVTSLSCTARTTGTCTCATARRCPPCCPSPPRVSRAPSSCRTSSRR